MNINIKIIIIMILSFAFSSLLISEEIKDNANAINSIDYNDLLDDIESNQPSDDSKTKISQKSEIGFMLSLLGDHSFIYHYPVINDHCDYYGYIKAPRFNNDLGIDIKYKILKLKAHWEIDAIVNESGDINDILKVKPLENSIVLSPWRFNIGAGYLYYTWGTADKMNPTDNLNPFDYTVGADKEKNSILSAFVEFFPVNFLSMQVVYIPFLEKDIYPTNFIEELKEKLEIENIKEKLPDYDPSTFTLGGKLNFYFQYIDFSFSYIYGFDKYFTPDIKLSAVKYYGNTLFYTIDSIELKKNRIHYFGTDFKTTISRFGIWGEICYAMSEDYLMNRYDIKNHKLSWSAGFDFNFGPNQDFYFNFQTFGDFSPFYDISVDDDYKDSDFGGKEFPFEIGKKENYYREYYYRAMVNEVGGITEGLSVGFSTSLKFPITIQQVKLEPSLSASYIIPFLYDRSEKIRYGNLYVNPEFKFSPIDSLALSVGADLYFAWEKENDKAHIQIAQKDKLGVYHYDSNIYFQINYKWGFDFYK
jgi:hypothetical protein